MPASSERSIDEPNRRQGTRNPLICLRFPAPRPTGHGPRPTIAERALDRPRSGPTVRGSRALLFPVIIITGNSDSREIKHLAKTRCPATRQTLHVVSWTTSRGPRTTAQGPSSERSLGARRARRGPARPPLLSRFGKQRRTWALKRRAERPSQCRVKLSR